MKIFLICLALGLVWVVLSVVRALCYYFRAKKPPVVIFPEDFGLVKEDIRVPVPGKGEISGWFIANPNSTKTIVLAHGFSMNKGDILRRTHFLAKDYNLCYFDFLGSGESTGRTDVGYSEPGDIEAVMRFIRQTKPASSQKMALYGLSQGAGAAVRYASTQQGVSCVILEAVYFSFKDIARRWIWKRRKTPYFPLVYSYLLFKDIKLHCRLDDLSPKNTAPGVTAPTLLIHGAKDTISPFANAEKVYALLSGPKELWAVAQAGHTSCAKEAAAAYADKINHFLSTYF